MGSSSLTGCVGVFLGYGAIYWVLSKYHLIQVIKPTQHIYKLRLTGSCATAFNSKCGMAMNTQHPALASYHGLLIYLNHRLKNT